VATEQAGERYRSALKRLGAPLPAAAASPAAAAAAAAAASTSSAPAASPLSVVQLGVPPSVADADFSGGLLPPLLRAASEAAAAQAEAAASSGRCAALFVDSLTTLAALAGDEAEWGGFLHHAGALGAQLRAPGFLFVALAHGDAEGDGRWLAALRHAADADVSVAPVEGSLAGIGGRVNVAWRDHSVAFAPRGGRAGSDGPPPPPPRDASLLFRAAGDAHVRWQARLSEAHLLH